MGKFFFPNATNTYQELTTGNASVTCTAGTGSSVLTFNDGRNYPYPNCVANPNWTSFASRFEGNLLARAPKLELPIAKFNVPLIEILRRGKNVGDKVSDGSATPIDVTTATQDDAILAKERFANKTGIRISLGDNKSELPGCANVATACGIQLDGSCNSTTNNCNGSGGNNSLGYQPVSMTDSYHTTAVNGNRLAVSGKQTWIKVEMVTFDINNNVPVTKDITQDFLSLGMTESLYTDSGISSISNPSDYNPSTSQKLSVFGYDTTTNKIQDSRSIIKIQRFFMDGQNLSTGSGYITNKTINSVNYNFIGRNLITVPSSPLALKNACLASLALGASVSCTVINDNDIFAPSTTDGGSVVNSNETDHYKLLLFPSDATKYYQIVPFPIEMYDSREGDRDDSAGPNGTVYRGGVMSMIDIDVANLRHFFNGDYDGKFPTTTPYALSNSNVGLKSTDVPVNQGWVVYVSDRRGDNDFNGRYKMENVSTDASSSVIDEDLDMNGTIDVDSTFIEAPRLDQTVDSTLASVTDHGYYRRGIRLINGITLPGNYDSVTESNTKGFTLASENGVYVDGNYNVQSVTLTGNSSPAPSTSYSPQGTSLHIPGAIIGDSVTILSNSWTDSNSFANPYDKSQRPASNTQVRFAMLSGDSLTSPTALTNGNFDGLNGGLHNFMRFLEDWGQGTKRLNYSGSLVNLFNSFNNNGKWKCCNTVYAPPTRDWIFDSTFTDPYRLPPGSPYVYYLSLTGFERTN